MALFSKQEKDQSQILKEATTSVLSTFNSTIVRLKEVIKLAENSIANNNKTIESLNAENQKLNEIVEDNTRITSKLSELFSPKGE